ALKRLTSLEARHVRCISGNPRKEDGESAEVIFQRLHYTSISDFLVNASKRRVDALTSCRDTYPGIAEDIQWQKAVHHSYLHPVLTVQSHKPAHPEQRSFQCPRTFDSMHAMRTHCARTHKISFVRPDLQKGTARREVGITQHCLNGLPTCKHCGFSFRKWSGFKGHILSACPVLHAQTAAEGGDHDGSNGFKTESNGKAAPLDSDTMSPCRDGAVTRPLNKDNLQSGCERPLAAEVPAADATATGSAEQSAAGPEPSTAASKIPQPPNDPADLPLSRQAEVLQTCKAGWVDLAAAQGEKLKFYCVICSPWCAPATGGLQSHMRRSHPTQWEMDRAIMHELKSHYRLKYKGLCKACGFQPTGPRMTTPGQQEVLTLFGQHLPSLSTQTPTEEAGEAKTKTKSRPRKWPKPEGKGGSQSSRATKGSRGWNNSWGSWDNDHQAKLTDQVSGEEVRNLLALVTRLSLRQEDDLAATRADNAFLFYLETRTTGTYRPIPSFAGHFFAIAQQWQKLRDETPEKLSLSLRATLLLAYMTEFHERLRHALEEEYKEAYLKEGWLQESGTSPCWTYSKWNAERREAIIDTSRTPITHAQILDSVARLLKLLSDSRLVHKFRATRPLAENYDSNILTFLMTVATRGQEADQLFATMLLLTDCNATRLMCTRIAKARQRRQPLAMVLSKEAEALLRATQPRGRPQQRHSNAKQDQAAMEECTARRPIYVPGLLPWASLLRRWTQLAQQQDASEFLAFLLQKLRSEAFAGTWAARLNDGDIVDCRDRGAIPPPLPLTEATFALEAAPQFFFLQLKRYRQDSCAVLHCRGHYRCALAIDGDAPAFLLSAFHWMPQGYFLQPELNEPFGLLAFQPTLAEASAAAKTRLGRGGQAHWHNTSYIGSSWGTIIGGLDVDSYKLTEDQLNFCMLFQSQWTLGQLYALLSIHCYSGALPRLAVHRHTMVPIWAIAAMPFQVQTLAHNGEEIDEVIDHGDSTPPKTTIDVVVPGNIDVNIKRA
ncbi:unnamed protein product, partial [Symbiodinium microadriaticum]